MNTPVRSMFIALFLLLSCLYISTGFAMEPIPVPGADAAQQSGLKADGADAPQPGEGSADAADAEDELQGVTREDFDALTLRVSALEPKPAKPGCLCNAYAWTKKTAIAHQGKIWGGVGAAMTLGGFAVKNRALGEALAVGGAEVAAYSACVGLPQSGHLGKHRREIVAALAGYGLGRLTPEATQVLVNLGVLKQERAHWVDDHRTVVAGGVGALSALSVFVYDFFRRK